MIAPASQMLSEIQWIAKCTTDTIKLSDDETHERCSCDTTRRRLILIVCTYCTCATVQYCIHFLHTFVIQCQRALHAPQSPPASGATNRVGSLEPSLTAPYRAPTSTLVCHRAPNGAVRLVLRLLVCQITTPVYLRPLSNSIFFKTPIMRCVSLLPNITLISSNIFIYPTLVQVQQINISTTAAYHIHHQSIYRKLPNFYFLIGFHA